MTDNKTPRSESTEGNTPSTSSIESVIAEVEENTSLSKIWLLPLIALIIGLGMLYEHAQNQGIPIKITLETAEGLEAGTTKIKSRNVEIGEVVDISFSEDRTRIVVDALIDNTMGDFLRIDSQFWVVRPRISKDGVSGIGTLFSGAYIGVTAGVSEEFEDQFDGLEVPPKTSPNADGLFLNLYSEGGKPLSPGDPVTYRGLNVGQVEFFQFDQDARTVNYSVFVRAPYHELVTTNTVFWKASGVSISATADGLNVDVAALNTLLSGGIEFDVPDEEALGRRVSANQRFVLYNSFRDTEERRQYDYIEYAVLVEDSVSGLSKGAPVDYRGVRIGTVFKPFMTYEEILLITGNRDEDRIPVIIRLEPERVAGSIMTKEEFREQVESWIKRGVTASVESTNLITGKLKVALDYRGEPIEKVQTFGPYPVIPANQGGFSGITKKIERILTKIDEIPINTIAGQVSGAFDSFEGTMSAASETFRGTDDALLAFQKTMSQLDQTLVEAESTLKGLQPGSGIYTELQETLRETRAAMTGLQPGASGYEAFEQALVKWQAVLDKMRPLLDALNNQPSALLFGASREDDIQPSVVPNN